MKYKAHTLYYTDDLSLFVLRGNRSIDLRHVERLKQHIQEGDYLPSQHITVRQEGRELVVADGQHRLLAAKDLGIGIWFIIDNKVTPDMTSKINASQKGWQNNDYLKFFADEKGHPEYQRLKDFLRETELPITLAISLASGGSGGPSGQTLANFKDGKFVFSHPTHAYIIARRSRDFAPYFKAHRHKCFVMAIVRLSAHPDYDHSRMMSKMEYQSTRLVKCPDVDSYVALLQDIYNHRTHGGNRISFAA
jgi:hypothetical protein